MIRWMVTLGDGDVHRNPLIGNPVVSPLGSEPGLELYHNGNGFGLMAGGGIGAPEQNFQDARNYSFRAKAWLDLIDNVYLSGSFYTVNHDAGVNRETNLLRRERHGSSYGAVWNLNNDNSGSGEGHEQVRPARGRELLKAEYVYQAASGFNEGTTGVATSVDVGMEPKFQGVVLEIGVSF